MTDFPSRQDVRTHNSVAAKREKYEGVNSPERIGITDPEKLCDAMLAQAQALYRRGNSVLHTEVRVLKRNFTAWAMRSQAAGHADVVDEVLMLNQVSKAASQLLRDRLSDGTVLVRSGYKCPSFGEVTFTATIRVINPRPTT